MNVHRNAADADTVHGDPVVGDIVTVYEVIGLPPEFDDSCHVTVARTPDLDVEIWASELRGAEGRPIEGASNPTVLPPIISNV